MNQPIPEHNITTTTYDSCESCGGACLEEVPLLQGIPEQQRRELIHHSTHIRCEKDDFLFSEGDPANAIWIIREGQVKLAKVDPEGHEQIVGLFADLDTIWEGLFLKNSSYPYSAICTTAVTACVIDIRDFRELLTDAHIAMDIIVLLSKKLHDANERNLILSTKSPESKIAGMLLYYLERTDEEAILLTLDQMAASLNLRPETVSRKLRELEKEGTITRIGKGKIQINHYAKLKEIYELGRQ